MVVEEDGNDFRDRRMGGIVIKHQAVLAEGAVSIAYVDAVQMLGELSDEVLRLP